MSRAPIQTRPDADRPRTAVPRPRIVRRGGMWSIGSACVAGLLAFVLGLVVIGHTLKAPDWVRDEVTRRIAAQTGGHQITFGSMSLVMGDGWRPSVAVRNVTVLDPEGLPLVALSSVEAGLALRPLLNGQVQPSAIRLSGAQATLRRGLDGSVAVEIGGGGGTVEEASSLPELLETWDAALQTPALAALASVELTSLTLRYDDNRSARSWTVDDGRIVLTRDGDAVRIGASLAVLSGRSYAAAIEANYESDIGTLAAEFGITIADVAAEDIAAQSPALAWLQPLRAPISGAVRGAFDDTGQMRPISATLSIGEGVLQPTEAARPIPFRSARSYFTFDPATAMLAFDEVSVDSNWVSGTAEGQAHLSGLDSGRLDSLTGQFRLGDVTVNPAGLYDEALQLAGADADFRLRLDPFDLTLGQVLVRDGETTVRISGDVAAGAEGWDVDTRVAVDAIDARRLVALWPEAAIATTRSWIDRNILAGRLHGVDVAVQGRPGRPPDVYVDFEYSDATVQYVKTLPPLTRASGHATLSHNRLSTALTAGEVVPKAGGAVDVTGTAFIVPDVSARPATPAIVRLNAQGSVTAALSILNEPPISALASSGLPVDLAAGQATLAGTLALPMQPVVTYDDITFHAAGTVRDVSSDVLVPGHSLAADQLAVTGTQDGVEVAGIGAISGIAADARWRLPLGRAATGASRVEGSLALSQDAVDTFGIGLPDTMVSGAGEGRFGVTIVPDTPVKLTVSSDLRGVGLRIPELGWRKGARSNGELQVEATLGAAPSVDRLYVRAAGLTASGTVRTRNGGVFDRADFSSLRIGNWLDAKVELRNRGVGLMPAINVVSGRLDMRSATFGSEGAGASGGDDGPLDIALQRLQVTDQIALTNFSGRFSTNGGLNGTFQGLVNGGAPVTGQLAPQNGRSAVRVVSDDAGGVIRDAGILRKVEGGDLSLTLLPVADPGQFDGTLRVTNTRVRNAPAIAALLNAVSIVGLLDEMVGQGIQFTEVDARFRLGPSRLTLASASAVGPSIGISMDGLYDVNSGQLDMQGVISPVYLLNGLGSILTRKGEGIIGFSYRLQGAAQAPRVIVNPLSALAPGMFREIFRRPPPTVGSTRGTVPEPVPREDVAPGGVSTQADTR